MVFSSVSFLFYFLPVIFVLYFLAPRKRRNLVLFLGSLFFYAWGEPVYILLMLFSILANYTLGRMMERAAKREESAKRTDRKWERQILVLAVVINIGLLVFFKYTNFFLENISHITGASLGQIKLPLPLGISFYTFQALSYVIDLYRRQVDVQKSLISFGTYVALFPQLIAGPIVRIRTVAGELQERTESVDLFSQGVRRFVIGMGKKVLLANNIGLIFTQISRMDPAHLPALTAWIGALSYTFQIYFDFSGYSDMAIGLGRMFGFHFLENFEYPYMAKSITEFWRRWHISLSTWFKEYVYIPLGGNRKGFGKQIRNILIVWLLTGFWHGANWNFVIWGLYFGLLLILEKLFLGAWLARWPALISHFFTMFLVVISWVIFAFDSMGKGLAFLQAMFCGNGAGLWDGTSLYLLSTNGLMLMILAVGSTNLPKRAVDRLLKGEGLGSVLAGNGGLFLMFLLCIAYLVTSTYNPFLYFRF